MIGSYKEISPAQEPTACVIGDPIAHSKSPLIHGGWLKEYQIQGCYHALRVRPEELGPAIAHLKAMGYRGLNVTLPHKQTVMEFCDELDDAAEQIGAVNTIIFENGKTIGGNTDAYGFIENLKQHCPDLDLSNQSVAILGAGGAARSIVYALLRLGITHIRIINRNFDRAKKLAENFGGACHALVWEGRSASIQDVGMIVNATSLGMTGQPKLEIDLSQISPGTIAYDIVYAPLKTEFLKKAKQQGCRIVPGLGMLMHQAAPGFEAWFGKQPKI